MDELTLTHCLPHISMYIHVAGIKRKIIYALKSFKYQHTWLKVSGFCIAWEVMLLLQERQQHDLPGIIMQKPLTKALTSSV